MDLRNLTPHPVVLRDAGGTDHTLPSVGVARVTSTPGILRELGLPVPVADADDFGEVTGLPDPEPGVFFLVSAMVGSAIKGRGREDVLVPGTGPSDSAVRDEKGRIIAVTRLKRI